MDSLIAEGLFKFHFERRKDIEYSFPLGLTGKYINLSSDSIYQKMINQKWGILLLSHLYGKIEYKIEIYPIDSQRQRVSASFYDSEIEEFFTFVSKGKYPDSIYTYFDRLKFAIPDPLAREGLLICGHFEMICYDGEFFYYVHSIDQKEFSKSFNQFIFDNYKSNFKKIGDYRLAQVKKRK